MIKVYFPLCNNSVSIWLKEVLDDRTSYQVQIHFSIERDFYQQYGIARLYVYKCGCWFFEILALMEKKTLSAL